MGRARGRKPGLPVLGGPSPPPLRRPRGPLGQRHTSLTTSPGTALLTACDTVTSRLLQAPEVLGSGAGTTESWSPRGPVKLNVPNSSTTTRGKETPPGTGDRRRDHSPPRPRFSPGTFWKGWLDVRPRQHVLKPPHASHCEVVTGAERPSRELQVTGRPHVPEKGSEKHGDGSDTPTAARRGTPGRGLRRGPAPPSSTTSCSPSNEEQGDAAPRARRGRWPQVHPDAGGCAPGHWPLCPLRPAHSRTARPEGLQGPE